MPEHKDNFEQEKFDRMRELQDKAQEFSDFQLEKSNRQVPDHQTSPSQKPYHPDIPGITRQEMPLPDAAEKPALTSVKDINKSLMSGLEKIITGKEKSNPSEWTEMIGQLQMQDEDQEKPDDLDLNA